MMMGSGRPAGAPFDRLKRSNLTRSPSALPRGPKAAASHAQWVGNPSAARGTSIQSCKQEPKGARPGLKQRRRKGERWAGDAGPASCGLWPSCWAGMGWSVSSDLITLGAQ